MTENQGGSLRGPTLESGQRILIVDDDPDIRRVLTLALGDEGYETREAANGVDALTATLAWRPDLILLDLMMPVMTGWQFAEAYGGLPGPRAPIVVMTAAGPGAIRSTEHLGTISAILAKPLDLGELLEVVRLHLSGAVPAHTGA